jgi:hypothetical protein
VPKTSKNCEEISSKTAITAQDVIGSNKANYYQKVLPRMVHPRIGKRLVWTRVADYFHEGDKTILNIRTILPSKNLVVDLPCMSREQLPKRFTALRGIHVRRSKNRRTITALQDITRI